MNLGGGLIKIYRFLNVQSAGSRKGACASTKSRLRHRDLQSYINKAVDLSRRHFDFVLLGLVLLGPVSSLKICSYFPGFCFHMFWSCLNFRIYPGNQSNLMWIAQISWFWYNFQINYVISDQVGVGNFFETSNGILLLGLCYLNGIWHIPVM